MTDYERAVYRVRSTPALAPYSDLLLGDWPELEHFAWVADAPLAEVLAWSEVLRQAELAGDDHDIH